MSLALAPFSLLYGAAVRARLALYSRGLLARDDVGAPVVSVGNLTAGGTGKTPLVAWVARALAADGRRVCVLSRGHGRRDVSSRVVVSDGARVMAGVEEGGDEPVMLAEELLGAAAVVCQADRAAAARWAREELGSEVFVLDDGFQHLRLARALDIVTVDGTAPWGGGRLLPRGRLREPASGLGRAGCVVITRSDMADDLEGLRAEVSVLTGGRAAVFASRVRVKGLRVLGGGDEVIDSDAVPRSVAALCAVGNPAAFFEQVRRAGLDLVLARAFPDHHKYTQGELDEVSREAEAVGARAVLTTAKDAVKLRELSPPLPFYVVETDLEFDDEAALLRLVREAAGGR